MEVRDAEEFAIFYGIPKGLMNAMFVELGGVAYPKEAALLHAGHKRGIQRIEVTKPTLDGEEYVCEARIYPAISLQKLAEINRLPPEMRKGAWDYLTGPTVEWGRAGVKNVRMVQMQGWLPEMAIKRAVCRALRLFAGAFGTSYEELPDAELSQDELRDAAAKAVSSALHP